MGLRVKEKLKMIYLEFEDPQYSEGWTDDDKTPSDHKDIVCRGIGIELERTKEFIRVCMAEPKYQVDKEDDFKLNIFKLPRSCVKVVRRLEFKKSERR